MQGVITTLRVEVGGLVEFVKQASDDIAARQTDSRENHAYAKAVGHSDWVSKRR